MFSVGALTLDTVFQVGQMPDHAGKFLAGDAKTMAAGMASSAAAAACRLGAAADIWASVGDDWAGRLLLDEMTALGVGTSHVRKVAGAQSAIAAILNDASGERLVVVHYDEKLLSAPETVPPVDWDRYDTVLVDVRWPSAARIALKAARESGAPGIFDADTGEVPDMIELAGLASHVVASQAGAERLSGEADPVAAARALHATYGVFTAVTAGGEGSFWMGDDGAVWHQPAPPIEVVDTNAAGDVFHGAFAVALAEGQSETAAMRFAGAAAAIKCTRFGGILGAPEREEVERFLPQMLDAVMV